MLYNFGNLGIENGNIDDLSGIFLLNIGRNGKVVVILGYLFIRHKAAEIIGVRALGERRHDLCYIFFGQLVIIRDLNAFFGSIDEKGAVDSYNTQNSLRHFSKQFETVTEAKNRAG